MADGVGIRCMARGVVVWCGYGLALTTALAGIGVVGSGSLHIGPATPPLFEFHQARDELSRTATQIGHCSAILDCALQQAGSL